MGISYQSRFAFFLRVFVVVVLGVGVRSAHAVDLDVQNDADYARLVEDAVRAGASGGVVGHPGVPDIRGAW